MSPFVITSNPPSFGDVAGYIHKSMIAIAVGKEISTGVPHIVGSGFAAEYSEYFLTCWHVINIHDELSTLSVDELQKKGLSDNILRIAFSTPNGFIWKDVEKNTWFRIPVKDHDICILRIFGIAIPPLEFNKHGYVFGQDVGIMGFPLGTQIQDKDIGPLVIRTILSSSRGIPKTTPGMEASQRIGLGSTAAGGFSGGPIFSTDDGQVIGIIASKLMENDNWYSRWPAGISLGIPSSIIVPVFQKAVESLSRWTVEAVKAYIISKESK